MGNHGGIGGTLKKIAIGIILLVAVVLYYVVFVKGVKWVAKKVSGSKEVTASPTPTPRDNDVEQLSGTPTQGRNTATPTQTENRAGYPIDERFFPDAAFREALTKLPGAEDGFFTKEEICLIDTLHLEKSAVKSLEGISVFTSLKNLYVQGSKLEELNVNSCRELEILECYGCG